VKSDSAVGKPLPVKEEQKEGTAQSGVRTAQPGVVMEQPTPTATAATAKASTKFATADYAEDCSSPNVPAGSPQSMREMRNAFYAKQEGERKQEKKEEVQDEKVADGDVASL
jgi:hypothetical protein